MPPSGMVSCARYCGHFSNSRFSAGMWVSISSFKR